MMLREGASDGDRPPPPPVRKERREWIVGEVVEAFDVDCCWRVGKIAKVLKNNVVVIRLFGSIQLKEFHFSNVRTQNKVARDKELCKDSARKMSKRSGRFVVKDGRRNHKGGRDDEKMVNRKQSYSNARLSEGLCGNLEPTKKVYGVSAANARQDWKLDNSFVGEIDAAMVKATSHCFNACSSSPSWNELSRQCSVASCSSTNDVAYSHSHRFRESSDNIADNSDAESSSSPPFINGNLTSSSGENLEVVDIHELEFHAYKSTVTALYASGPLSWEQESLLTNLRLVLHITDEEHLLQLRHLLST